MDKVRDEFIPQGQLRSEEGHVYRSRGAGIWFGKLMMKMLHGQSESLDPLGTTE